MKKKFIVLTALFSLMIFILAGCGEKNQQQNQTTNSNQNAQQSRAIKGSFEELLGKGQNLQCEFSLQNEESKMRGVAYTDGERLYQEVSINQDGNQIKSKTLVKGESVYTWDSSQTRQGMKIKLNKSKKTSGTIPEEEINQENKNLDQIVNYECESWQVEESKFQVPTDINFTDIEALTEDPQMNDNTNNQNGSQGANSINSNQEICDACQYAPNPDECLEEMGC